MLEQTNSLNSNRTFLLGVPICVVVAVALVAVIRGGLSDGDVHNQMYNCAVLGDEVYLEGAVVSINAVVECTSSRNDKKEPSVGTRRKICKRNVNWFWWDSYYWDDAGWEIKPNSSTSDAPACPSGVKDEGINVSEKRL